MLRRFRAVLVLEGLAVLAMIASALLRHRMAETNASFVYLPIGDEQADYDGWALLSVLDARLWFGMAVGLAVAGLVVGVLNRVQQP